MYTFILLNPSTRHKKLLEFHGCSLTLKNGMLQVEHGHESYETLSKSILELNFKNFVVDYIYAVKLKLYEPKRIDRLDLETTYFGVDLLVKALKDAGLVILRLQEAVYTLNFTVEANSYVRLFSILKTMLVETCRDYELVPLKPLNLKPIPLVLTLATVATYTDCLQIAKAVKPLLQTVNYEVKTYSDYYSIICPVYKRNYTIQQVMGDLIHAYYLLNATH